MTTPAAPRETNSVPTAYESPPPMPSIVASALIESRLLVALTRRTVAALLMRG
jgi:hypothetical protein